jgi:hypothetical protein
VSNETAAIPALLIQAVLDPRVMLKLDLRSWERLLSCARRNAVLAYLAQRSEAAGVLEEFPPAPRDALRAARAAAARLAQLAIWEVDRVARVLFRTGIPLIALKGAAYLLRGMPHAATRLLTDVDIMVPRERIDQAESELLAAGWQNTKLDAYDQRYYRRWSHELPPLHYPGRVLGIDVHHTICPPVSRIRPDPAALWASAETSHYRDVKLLSPSDSVLHAAVHLFFDSDLDGRFRDLIDLHELLSALGSRPGFWTGLLARAREQGLGRPLYYAVATLQSVLGTPIPPEPRGEVERFRPAAAVDGWMKQTLATLLTPVDPEPWPPAHRLSLWLMFVRSHWLRMPPHLLLPHLLRKSWRRIQPVPAEA